MADKKRYGGKLANEERIRKNREREEERQRVLEIERIQEELERKQWAWASGPHLHEGRRPADESRKKCSIWTVDGNIQQRKCSAA